MFTQQSQQQQHEIEDQDILEPILSATEKAMAERADLLQMRMENETIMSECRARPRSLAKIKKALEDAISTFPELADEAIYEKPVGKDETGTQKYARNLSVRAAEVLAEAYGFNRVRTDCTPLGDDKAKVEATFTDFQTCRIWQDSGIVSQFYTTRNKQRIKHQDDRFWGVVVKAEASKRVREVILRAVNPGLKAWFREICERQIESLLNEKTVEKMLAQFATINVTLEDIERLLGRLKSQGWTKDDWRRLNGIWNAIKDGEATIAEIFHQPKQEEANPEWPTGRVPVRGPNGTANGTKEPPKTAEADPNQTPQPVSQTSTRATQARQRPQVNP